MNAPSQTGNISSRVQTITNMVVILVDLKHPLTLSMIMAKITPSLPPSFNNVIAAWSNVDPLEQIVDLLEERLFQHEAILKGKVISMKAVIRRFSHELLGHLEQHLPNVSQGNNNIERMLSTLKT